MRLPQVGRLAGDERGLRSRSHAGQRRRRRRFLGERSGRRPARACRGGVLHELSGVSCDVLRPRSLSFSVGRRPSPRSLLSGAGADHRIRSIESVVEPASSPAALAVGAVCWQTGQLEQYSSLGPTIDGRTEARPRPRTTASRRRRTGLPSAGDARLRRVGVRRNLGGRPAGRRCAALLLQQKPTLTPAELTAALEERAEATQRVEPRPAARPWNLRRDTVRSRSGLDRLDRHDRVRLRRRRRS